MKISLRWVFDHIKGELSNVEVPQLVEAFIKTTAEIEGWREVAVDSDALTLAQVVRIESDTVVVHSPERGTEYILPFRADAFIDQWFMIVANENAACWATATVFGGIKDMMLPAMYCSEDMRKGAWKNAIEQEDYIIEVDNKSINSRPDLWSHRGLAREIAAILNLPLKRLEDFVVEKESTHQSLSAIKALDACDRFATLHLTSVVAQPSDIAMLVRLSRIDSRAINFLVDATNYVMLDLGQPMHAFDTDLIATKQISVAYARDKEKLALLDGETIELTGQDLVIADGDTPISLAGIMGGAATAINTQTRSVLLEVAHFDPVIIRRSSARHKKRTESSVRFEKNIDPACNIDAIKRFLFLLDKAHVAYVADETISSWGDVPEHTIISVQHMLIEERLGVILKPEKVMDILEKLAFSVEQSVENDSIMYLITVPSFRATKDIKIPADIVEEIGRYIGYDTLPRVMPALHLRSHDLHVTNTTRAIKNFLSFGLQMRELYGYSFFDELWLHQLAWQPVGCVDIKNPISENYTRMVTTLQPHLLKAIGDNSINHTQLRFYEWARIWHMRDKDMIEQKSVSGVLYDATQVLDFYTGKSMLSRLFDQVDISITWQPVGNNDFTWFALHQTAMLMHRDLSIGIAGMIERSVVHDLSPAGGSIFMFELNADYLLSYKKSTVRFEPLSKYPSVRRDVSIKILASASADALIGVIKNVDRRIVTVDLIDFFSKPEWEDQKAMTFAVEIEDKEKTMTSQEVDVLWNRVIMQLQQQGAVIR